MRLCTYEDRPADIVGVKLLALSLRRYAPATALDVYLPTASGPQRAWFASQPNVRLHPADALDRRGWDVKPRLLLNTLNDGAVEAAWIDADILLTAGLQPVWSRVPPQVLIVAEEWSGASSADTALRTRAWGLAVGRVLPAAVNSCVIRASAAHRELLSAWDELLGSDEYRRAQALPWYDRPWHAGGDQDVLTALLGSARFAHIPIHWLRQGRQIAQCFRGRYATRFRLANLARRRIPTFIHSQVAKPWRQMAGMEATTLRLSPYALAARRYRRALEADGAWLDDEPPLARALRWLCRDHAIATGLLPELLRGAFGSQDRWDDANTSASS